MDSGSYFENLIAGFEVTLQEFSKEKRFERFRLDFEKVLKALKDALKVQTRLLNKCKELNAEIGLKDKEINNNKMQIEEDHQTIGKLKEDLEISWKTIDSSKRNELKSLEEIQSLKSEIAALEEAKILPVSSEGENKDMTLGVEAIEERNALRIKVIELEAQFIEEKSQKEESQDKLSEALVLIQQYENELNALKSNLEVEHQRRTKSGKDSILLQKEIISKSNKVQVVEKEILEAKKTIDSLIGKIDSCEGEIEEYANKNEELKDMYERVQNEAIIQSQAIKDLKCEIETMHMQIKEREDQLSVLNKKLAKALDVKESSIQNLTLLKNHKKSAEMKLALLKSELLTAGREMNAILKKQSQDNKNISNLIREKELLANNLIRMEALTEKYLNETKISEKERITLLQELKTAQECVESQKKVISSLDKARHRLLNEIHNMTKKMEDLHDETYNSENKVDSLKKQVADLFSQVRQKTDLYQAALEDRNMYCKYYKEAKITLEQQREKMEILDRYIEQMKEEAQEREDELMELNDAKEKLENEKKILLEKLKKQQTATASTKFKLKCQEDKIRQYIQTISEKSQENQTLQSKVNETIKDRNVLGVQLMRRNDEISLLYEKAKVQEAVIAKGERMYMRCCQDLKNKEQEILSCTREKTLMTQKLEEMEKMKQDLSRAQQELIDERSKGKALEKELEKPLNIHRWRLLKGNDPEHYELLIKSQVLQKRLVSKSLEAAQTNQELQQKEKLVEELRVIIAKQATVEGGEMVVEYKRQVQTKSDKIKCLLAQVNMYETYMANYKTEIESLKDELRKFKSSEFLKRAAQKHAPLDDDDD